MNTNSVKNYQFYFILISLLYVRTMEAPDDGPFADLRIKKVPPKDLTEDESLSRGRKADIFNRKPSWVFPISYIPAQRKAVWGTGSRLEDGPVRFRPSPGQPPFTRHRLSITAHSNPASHYRITLVHLGRGRCSLPRETR